MSLLLFDDSYYQLLVQVNKHYGSYQKLFTLECTKEDHYIAVSDSSWLLTFYKGEMSQSMKSYCAYVGAHCLGILAQTPNVLDEAKVKCWLCDKEAEQTTQHLKIIKLTNLINGFELATESYQVCMKNHSSEDPSKYINEICFPKHLKGYMKERQKMEHKFIIITNGFATNHNLKPIALCYEIQPGCDDYVVVGDYKCPFATM
ncbi:pv2 protein [Tenuivirus persotritici]|uniref:Pv2 protein n=1 Tax=Tenuivirus persotritici TaxID=3052765 RepID=Q7TBM0_9VIRU|nr:pv2 protein [Tenuivirus persotritici]AAP82273.1 pv2 protein [Tenuivirus persotritici]